MLTPVALAIHTLVYNVMLFCCHRRCLLCCLAHAYPGCLAHAYPDCLALAYPGCLASAYAGGLYHAYNHCLYQAYPGCLAHAYPGCLAHAYPGCLGWFSGLTLIVAAGGGKPRALTPAYKERWSGGGGSSHVLYCTLTPKKIVHGQVGLSHVLSYFIQYSLS